MNFVDYTDQKTGKLIMSAADSRKAFTEWVNNDDYAKNHRGQYAERNSNLSNGEHEIDLHLGANHLQRSRTGQTGIYFRHYQLCQYVEQEMGSNLWFTL